MTKVRLAAKIRAQYEAACRAYANGRATDDPLGCDRAAMAQAIQAIIRGVLADRGE